jgi:hypothetical protein
MNCSHLVAQCGIFKIQMVSSPFQHVVSTVRRSCSGIVLVLKISVTNRLGSAHSVQIIRSSTSQWHQP